MSIEEEIAKRKRMIEFAKNDLKKDDVVGKEIIEESIESNKSIIMWLRELQVLRFQESLTEDERYIVGYNKGLDSAKKIVKGHMGWNKGYSFNNEMEEITEEIDNEKKGDSKNDRH